ncbi:MAG: hypothetical protein AAF206_27815 [Bacteroidota bacterium]
METTLSPDALDVLESREETQAPNTPAFEADDLGGFPDREEFFDEEPDEEVEAARQLDEFSADDDEPAYMRQIEEYGDGIRDGSFDEDDIEGVGDLVVGLVDQAKQFINRHFKAVYKKRLKQEFPESRQKVLSLVTFLDHQGEMNTQSIPQMKKWADEYSVSLPDLISAYVDYREIRDDLQASIYQDWQKDGIRKYTERSVRKYMNAGAVDPLFMLGLYVAVALGMDIFKVIQNQQKKSE